MLARAAAEVPVDGKLLRCCSGIVLDFCKPDFVQLTSDRRDSWRRRYATHGLSIDGVISQLSDIKKTFNTKVYFGIGLHPMSASAWFHDDFRQAYRRRVDAMRMLPESHGRLLCLGETGVDFAHSKNYAA